MPGWHAKTKDLAAAGKLAVAGIVQEQHGDRAALFMQWKQMAWPVMVDPLNLVDVRAVPLTYLIDEHGIIRAVNPKGDALDQFLATEFPPTTTEAPKFVAEDEATALAVTATNAVTPSPVDLDKAIAAGAEGAKGQFRLGVLYRKRYDSPGRQSGDFGKAVAAWAAALEEVPSQYIWRRRIQQYGPLLDKPYPFYDWVFTARNDIAARGEAPLLIAAELSGAEIARPSKKLASKVAAKHPDPDGKLPNDIRGLIGIEHTIVPSTDRKNSAIRLHLSFTPDPAKDAHWNNESGVSTVWIEQQERQLLSKIWVNVPTETEARNVEFEFDNAATGTINGSAFYYICEGADGTCQYLRQDFEIVLE